MNVAVYSFCDWVILVIDLLHCLFVKYFDFLAVITESDLFLAESDQSSQVLSYAHVTEKTNENTFKWGAEISSQNDLFNILTDIVSVVDVCTEVTHDLVALCSYSDI